MLRWGFVCVPFFQQFADDRGLWSREYLHFARQFPYLPALVEMPEIELQMLADFEHNWGP